jgi:DNA modification methylase
VLSDAAEAQGEPSGRDDEIPDAPAESAAVSQAGDLWALGVHRLLCGDALDVATYTTLMAGEQAEMVFTDPPYNVRIDRNVSGLGRIRHREFAMASGEMTEAEFIGFLDLIISP